MTPAKAQAFVNHVAADMDGIFNSWNAMSEACRTSVAGQALGAKLEALCLWCRTDGLDAVAAEAGVTPGSLWSSGGVKHFS